MKTNRESVVQAALVVERWCAGIENCMTQCPFFVGFNSRPCALDRETPEEWKLEEFLRSRGLRGGESDDRTPGADSGAD